MQNYVPFAGVRRHVERIHLVLDREELRSYTDKSLIQRKSRLCNMYAPRVFLRSGSDGKQHCPSCENCFFLFDSKNS